MGLLDDFVKLKFGEPLGNAIGNVVDYIRQNAITGATTPILKKYGEDLNTLSRKGGEVNPNDIAGLTAKTYADLYGATSGRVPKETLEQVKSLSDIILQSTKEKSTMAVQGAQAGYIGAEAAQEAVKTNILAKTGISAADAQIELDKAHADYFRSYWAGQERLKGLEVKFSKQAEDKKYVDALALSLNTNIQDDPELLKALQGINIDDYLKVGNIDLGGLAEKAAKNAAGDKWSIYPPAKKQEEIFKYRLKVHESLYGNKQKQQDVQDTQELNILMKAKESWDADPMYQHQGQPFPYQSQLDVAIQKKFGGVATDSVRTAYDKQKAARESALPVPTTPAPYSPQGTEKEGAYFLSPMEGIDPAQLMGLSISELQDLFLHGKVPIGKKQFIVPKK